MSTLNLLKWRVSVNSAGADKVSADGDGWYRARGLGPCRLIIDQQDRDGSRGGEDTEERRERRVGELEKWGDFREFMF
ncbi:hypothetical protein Q5P01_016035 [Channa striata]|uniref:Uncharacterized protein n=1 Tax=Channa striata TaxID=64152 RepID=A0AA88MFK2_CHASR|nr:hypothetical protein Q5P01_016035 [Channa striata]